LIEGRIIPFNRRVFAANSCGFERPTPLRPSVKALNRLQAVRGRNSSVPGTPSGAGLNGRSAAEIEEVKERTEAIREEKVARGETPRPVELHVVHDRRPMSRRTIGRN
jgi:hypothetical protein